MPQAAKGTLTVDYSEYLYKVHIVFRWMVLGFFLVVLTFVPWSLPRSNAYYWYALAVLLCWNIFSSAIIPLFAPRIRAHPALIMVDLVLAITVTVTGGGHGNVLLLYAFSTIVLVGLTWGTLPCMLSSFVLGLTHLLSLLIPIPTMIVYFGQVKGLQTVEGWAVAYPIVGFVVSYLHDRGSAIALVVEEENKINSRAEALSERSSLLGAISNHAAETLKGTLVDLRKIGGDLKSGEVPGIPERLEQIAGRFRAAVDQSRMWLKSVRRSEMSDANTLNTPIFGKSTEAPGLSVDANLDVRDSQVEHAALTIIFGFRFVVLALACFFFFANPGPHGVRYGLELIAIAATYNLILALVLLPRGCSRPVALVSMDLLFTFFLLFASGGFESIFLIYVFFTPALGATYFRLGGTLATGLIMGALYSISLVGNGITPSYLRSIGVGRDLFEPSFEYLLVGLSVCLVITTYNRLVAERKEAGRALAAEAQLEERLRVAREVHDGAVQAIASLAIRTELLSEKAGAGMRAEDFELHIKEIEDLAEDTIAELAELSGEKAREDQYIDVESELINLLDLLNARTGIAYNLDTSVPRFLAIRRPGDLRSALVEIIRNVEKHSGAGTIRVSASAEDGRLEVVFTDDGVGFDSKWETQLAAGRGHFGLVGLQESIKASGGDLKLETGPGRGTKVVVDVPTLT